MALDKAEIATTIIALLNVGYGSWLRENVEVQRTLRRRFLRDAIEVMKIGKWDQFPLI